MLVDFFLLDKTTAPVDVWTVQHFLAGMLWGWGIQKLYRYQTNKELGHAPITVLTLLLCLGWELGEWAGEVGLWGQPAQNWFAGVEFWSNRWIFDPLAVLLGAWLMHGIKYHRAITAGVALLAGVWLSLTLWSPNAMYWPKYMAQWLQT